MKVVEDSLNMRTEGNVTFVDLSVESERPEDFAIQGDVINLARSWLTKEKGLTNLAVQEVSTIYPAHIPVKRGTVIAVEGYGKSPLHELAEKIPPDERRYRVDITFVLTGF